MNVFEKLLAIQTELKAPKSQYNEFGKYNYRNCEDILEAVKPICFKYKAVVFVSDVVQFIEGRHYIEATATFVDCEIPSESIIVTAFAREEENKKGMDGSQVTGASSSYARKYALNGLFDIDDTKDSDATNQVANCNKSAQAQPKPQFEQKHDQTKIKLAKIKEIINGSSFDLEDVKAFITQTWGEEIAINSLTDERFDYLVKVIKKNIKTLEESSHE